ncbi:MAG TPA: hypothetical protein VGM67_04515 [Gemmatimonadaceae bacterium]|jgi:hypothetical protein
MHATFALFADSANLSQDGKLNILGVFDALQVMSLPAMHPRAHLVLHLKGSPDDVGTHTVGFRWLSPNGQELWTSTGELNVGPPAPGATGMDLPLIAQLDLPLDAAGDYTMAIALDGQPATDVTLHVRTAVKMPTASIFS